MPTSGTTAGTYSTSWTTTSGSTTFNNENWDVNYTVEYRYPVPAKLKYNFSSLKIKEKRRDGLPEGFIKEWETT